MRGIGPYPRCGVNADLEPHAVNFVGQTFHIGEFRIGLDGIVFSATLALPAVVDVDVGPAVVDEPLLDHRTG